MVDLGHEVVLVAERFDRLLSGVLHVRYAPEPSRSAPHPALVATDHHVRTGEAVARSLDRLRRRGRVPDLVVGHVGWGGLLFVKDVLPHVPVLGYCEFFHQARGGDLDFGAERPASPLDRARARMRNAAQLTTLHGIEAGLAPTRFQRDGYPSAVRSRIGVCHDGIDVATCRPAPDASLTLPDGRILRAGQPIVTYAARDLEPYRGFPQFLDVAAEVARRCPEAVFVAVGRDGVSYGARRPDGRSWREAEMERSGLDPSRIAFPGWLTHDDLVRLFQVSAAHVYLTVPFVLSWSMVEAMACGCVLVGSATAPVEEVIEHGRNGLLADFFDVSTLARHVEDALLRPAAMRSLRQDARRTVERRYSLPDCLDRQTTFVRHLLGLNQARRSRAASA